MSMSQVQIRYRFRAGVENRVMEYFTVHGPYTSSYGPLDHHWSNATELFYVDFMEGEDVCIATQSSISAAEADKFPLNEPSVYYRQGQQAGEDIMKFLANSTRFEKHIRGQWWFRGYYRTQRFFEKAFARLCFWRYTWVAKMFAPSSENTTHD